MPSADSNKPDKDSDEPETIFDLHPRQDDSRAPEPELPAPQPRQETPPEPQYSTRGVPPLMPLPQPRKEKKDPEPAGQERYDFFLEDKPKKKKSANPLKTSRGGQNSQFMRIVIVAAGFVLVLILLAVVINAFRSSNNKANAGLSSLVVTQQEIIRISDDADEKLRTTAMKNFAKTAKNTTLSAQQDLKSYLALHGVKINEKQLEASADPENDKVLAAAEAADTYDSTYKKTMESMLDDYHASLAASAGAAATEEEKELLNNDVDSVQLLQVMIAQQ